MHYATLTDLNTRYPGELQAAGPKDATGALDAVAIGIALTAADEPINMALETIGWSVPVVAPVPGWITDLAVDIALYLATPTVLASQDDFSDRHRRYEAALDRLSDIASGRLMPARPANNAAVNGVYSQSNERRFGRGIL
jgi:phage gp36-like protein